MKQPNDATDVLMKRLEVWVNNAPDYFEMRDIYKKYGITRAAITRKKRDIDRTEELITAEIDRPRSNDARKAKLNATAVLKDELAELEADLALIESEVKALEFMKTMFSSANYRTKLQMDL